MRRNSSEYRHRDGSNALQQRQDVIHAAAPRHTHTHELCDDGCWWWCARTAVMSADECCALAAQCGMEALHGHGCQPRMTEESTAILAWDSCLCESRQSGRWKLSAETVVTTLCSAVGSGRSAVRNGQRAQLSVSRPSHSVTITENSRWSRAMQHAHSSPPCAPPTGSVCYYSCVPCCIQSGADAPAPRGSLSSLSGSVPCFPRAP